MDISGTVVFNKLREMIPSLPTSITPEVLGRMSDETAVQPFLNWFCRNVTRENVLTEEEVRIKNYLEKKGPWLRGAALDSALVDATRDCPELLQLVSAESSDFDCHSDLGMEKESYDEDLEYLIILEKSIETLKVQEEKLSEEIEYEDMIVQKERIETEEAYKDCMDLLRDFDLGHRELFRDVDRLVNIYADAAERKGPPVLWTQMPLELCRNQTELYNNYLAVYINRQFGDSSRQDLTNDLDNANFIEDTREKCSEDILQELSSCNRNLITSTIDEITSRVLEDACNAMAEYAVNIYNNGNLKTPLTQSQLEVEIAELSSKRDFLEENLRLLREEQLEVAVTQSADLEITKILVKDRQVKLERRDRRLGKMLRVRELARERGHAHPDLLCMLMELQLRRLVEALEVVADARYYLAAEYSLSSVRLDVMQRLQAEYKTMLSAFPSEWNAFNKIFISMLLGNDDDQNSLILSMKQYDRLTSDNNKEQQKMLGVDLDSRIDCIRPLENKVNALYNRESNDGPTMSLKSTSYELRTRIEDTEANIEQIQDELTTIRNRMKETMKKGIAPAGLEREKLILWQRFLADPQTLKRKYEEAERTADQKHFTNTL